MRRLNDISGEFSMDFHLEDIDKIMLWTRARANIECVFVVLPFCMLILINDPSYPPCVPPSMDISQARCISLACYSVHDIHPHTINQGETHRQFEVAEPVPFTKIPRVLWFLMNEEFTFFYPPYEVRLLRVP